MTPFINTEAVEATLNQTAIALQTHFVQETGEWYGAEDLQRALTQWLELSIEALAEDALFHAVEGDRAYAFNRRAFELQMQRIQSQPLQSQIQTQANGSQAHSSQILTETSLRPIAA
ncbi:MAG: hypothetical protein KME15_19500 [Drouetiella hepatica Uher 2000/2452]|jgi:hypothetical protein|uniref:Uncharacterized protein n=1 Tax=Drouetiella hepatica Uher 2000/2452 TaxID=904376 RepID=A0A951QE22_9CYAN|nr:hypothetical protein [Drouetiella hepatica Uher 2000/2452]